MKTSELIEKLQASLAEHGDLEVVVDEDQWPTMVTSVSVEEVGYSDLLRDGSAGSAFTKYEPNDTVYSSYSDLGKFVVSIGIYD